MSRTSIHSAPSQKIMVKCVPISEGDCDTDLIPWADIVYLPLTIESVEYKIVTVDAKLTHQLHTKSLVCPHQYEVVRATERVLKEGIRSAKSPDESL